MRGKSDRNDSGVSCLLQAGTNLSEINVVKITPETFLKDYIVAMKVAEAEAEKELGNVMLISWYDRDRDFESPQHSSECHLDGAVPGYVDYGLSHGATLMIDIEKGRFIFFYMPV